MRFLGNIEAKTDAKGRVFLPAVFRKQLQTAGEEQLVLRIAAAERELSRFRLYDYVVTNDDLATAARELETLFRAFRLRTGLIPEGSVPWNAK